MSFEELGLKDEVVRAITALGYESPTPIQEQAIPSLIETHRDLVGLAQTGTGKTAAFGLPVAHLVNFSQPVVQALILCPTRELCLQISKDLKDYCTQLVGSRITPVYGGSSIDVQIRDLRKGSQIVVATPGRLIDLIKRGKVDLSHVDIAILDEADEMLNMGFKEDIDTILSETPSTKRTWLFSATMPKGVAAIAKNFMDDPLEITVGSKNSSASTITHKYVSVNGRNRYPALKRLLDFNPEIYGIVFCNTRNHTREVAEKLSRDGYNAAPLHGDLSQAERDSVMSKFRSKTTTILVATDVAARGLDVDEISHVVHYMLPDDVENYTHRSGRTGRAGKEGESIAIIDPRDGYKVRDIERIMDKKLELFKLPDAEDICSKQLSFYVKSVSEIEPSTKELAPYMDGISEVFADMTKEEVIARFVSSKFEDFLEYYRNAPDLNVSGRNSGRERDSSPRPRRTDENFQRLFINVGTMDGIDKGAILRLVCSKAPISASSVGRIDLKNQFSFVEVETKYAAEVVQGLTGADLDGREVKAEFSAQESGGSRGGGGGYRGGSGGGGRRSEGGRRPEGRRREGGGGSRRRTEGSSSGSRDGGSSRRSFSSDGDSGRKPFERFSKRTQHK